ncbi:MAG: type VI secretion system-associated FHA domain protein TagH [Aquabacterium sp.]|nr:type VI secretion system-associated FHA domain protein TagH [Aquabacterium sp.]
MTLTLLAVSLNERPLSQPITAHFDSRGGTIGRADHNTMALPDPERHVSRLQAEIVASGATFVIRNVGAANAIVVAGRAVGCGETAKLSQGDEIRIGGYLLQVDAREQEAALDVTRGRAMISATLSPAPPSPVAAPEAPALAPAPPAAWSPPTAPPAVAAPVVPAPTPAAGGGNPFADLLGGAATPAPATAPATADPFADLFGAAPANRPAFEPAPRPAPSVPPSAARPSVPPAPAAGDPFADLMPPPAGVLPSSAGLAPPIATPPARLPDDFDPFAAPAAASRPLAAAPAAADPFADLVPASAPSSIDALFGLGPASQDPLAHFMAGAPAGPAAGGDAALPGVPTDPLLAMFGDVAPPAQADAPPQADDLSALNAAYVPPRVVPPVPQVPQRPPVPPVEPDLPLTFSGLILPAAQPGPLPSSPALVPAPAPAPNPMTPAPRAAPARAVDENATDAERLWAALCEGAGIELPLPDGGPEERLREVGRILRSAVDGTLRLMAVRASTKHELRADVTVIQSRDNNPLKFSPDAKVGLEYLLRPSMRGFLEGPAAMDDAMHDLVGHSIGTVAGMRAAISGMLDRFSPQQLEAKLAGKSVLDSVLPINRKAKLWDLYLQHHESIREEAQEDFQHLFGRAFLAAYEQQIAQLRRTSKPT